VFLGLVIHKAVGDEGVHRAVVLFAVTGDENARSDERYEIHVEYHAAAQTHNEEIVKAVGHSCSEPGLGAAGGRSRLVAGGGQALCLGIARAHYDAEGGVPGDGHDGPNHCGGESIVENVHHVFYGREAQRGKHRVHDGVEFIVEGRMAPGEALENRKLHALLDEAGDGKVAYKRVGHGIGGEDVGKLLRPYLQHDHRQGAQYAEPEKPLEKILGLGLHPVHADYQLQKHIGRQQRGRQQ